MWSSCYCCAQMSAHIWRKFNARCAAAHAAHAALLAGAYIAAQDAGAAMASSVPGEVPSPIAPDTNAAPVPPVVGAPVAAPPAQAPPGPCAYDATIQTIDCPNQSCYAGPPNGCGSRSLAIISADLIPDRWPAGVDFTAACNAHDV